jgi:hypothetical protein
VDMIVNFWIVLSPALQEAVEGVAQVVAPGNSGRPTPPPPVIKAERYHRLNHLMPQTLKMLRNFPERHKGTLPEGLWNCYISGEGLHSFVRTRQDLERLEANYDPNFLVVGCWDFHTGQPVGGVGSPWFVRPPKLTAIIPEHDVVLAGGQGKRNFV